MAYPTARAQIVTMIEALSASTLKRVGDTATTTFKHFADAHEGKLPRSRGFWLRGVQHSQLGPYTPGLPTRMHSEMVLTVCYRMSSDCAVDDEVIALDHKVLSTSLLDASQWGRPTSTIISIHAAGDLLCPGVLEVVEGARLLRISFPLEYTA